MRTKLTMKNIGHHYVCYMYYHLTTLTCHNLFACNAVAKSWLWYSAGNAKVRMQNMVLLPRICAVCLLSYLCVPEINVHVDLTLAAMNMLYSHATCENRQDWQAWWRISQLVAQRHYIMWGTYGFLFVCVATRHNFSMTLNISMKACFCADTATVTYRMCCT